MAHYRVYCIETIGKRLDGKIGPNGSVTARYTPMELAGYCMRVRQRGDSILRIREVKDYEQGAS